MRRRLSHFAQLDKKATDDLRKKIEKKSPRKDHNEDQFNTFITAEKFQLSNEFNHNNYDDDKVSNKREVKSHFTFDDYETKEKIQLLLLTTNKEFLSVAINLENFKSR
jgi:hypothetical protein